MTGNPRKQTLINNQLNGSLVALLYPSQKAGFGAAEWVGTIYEQNSLWPWAHFS